MGKRINFTCYVCERMSVAQLCTTLCDHMDCITSRLLCPWNSPGKNTRVVAIPVSRGSSQPRDQTWVSCTAGRFFTIWAWNQNGLSYMHGLKFRANLLGCLKTRSVDPFWSAYTLTGLDSSSRPLEWTLWSWEKFQAEENFVIIDFLQVLISTDIDIDIEVTQLCPTLCDPMDCSLSGSSVHEIFQARVLECEVESLVKPDWELHLS